MNDDPAGPWNPGIRSQLPRALLPLATVYRADNVSTSLEAAEELRDFTGLELHELVAFRPERLALHAVLVRVTADLAVSDGDEYEALGVNFRTVAALVLERHVAPEMPRLVAAHEALRVRLRRVIGQALAEAAPTSSPGPRAGFLRRLLGAGRGPAASSVDPAAREQALVERWRDAARETKDRETAAALRALARVAAAVRARHGRLLGGSELLADIATDLAANDAGSELASELVDPLLRQAVEREDLPVLPIQARPLVMNTKGASAAGKSTLRPHQRRLAAEIGVAWSDFALISPDIWRKFLLDYDSLGEHRRYAGTFTGHELKIVDQKLDRYMAARAESKGMTHLLIDRFRFDSFAPASDERGSNLLTRFGHHIYMFFMITPPHETVERAWRRGLDVGRFKAVDDLLYHNVEAFTGMPELFFTWALRDDRPVQYEFLDNAVARGERPRTAAFGRNGEMVVLDMRRLIDIDRFRKIDVEATTPEAVYPSPEELAPERNVGFVTQCARALPAISLASQQTGVVYARIEAGRLAWADPDGLAAACEEPDTRAGLLAIAPEALAGGYVKPAEPVTLWNLPDVHSSHTLGAWGSDRSVR